MSPDPASGAPPSLFPPSRPLLILKPGDTFAGIAQVLGDFEHWIAEGLSSHGLSPCVLDPRRDGALPDPAHPSPAPA